MLAGSNPYLSYIYLLFYLLTYCLVYLLPHPLTESIWLMCIHASMHECMQACIHPHMQTYKHICTQRCIHEYIHASMRPCIHTYTIHMIHTTNAPLHTSIQRPSVQTLWCTRRNTSRIYYTDIHACKLMHTYLHAGCIHSRNIRRTISPVFHICMSSYIFTYIHAKKMGAYIMRFHMFAHEISYFCIYISIYIHMHVQTTTHTMHVWLPDFHYGFGSCAMDVKTALEYAAFPRDFLSA